MRKSRIYRLNTPDQDWVEETPLVSEDRSLEPHPDEEERAGGEELQRLVFDNRQRINRR